MPPWLPAAAVISRAARSKARMNSRPMILRFSSGSVTPASAARNVRGRVHHVQVHPGRGHEVLLHLLRLAPAQQPVIDEHAAQPGPMARCTRAAATAESTPPDSPQIARPSPTCAADPLDLLVDHAAHGPRRAGSPPSRGTGAAFHAVLGVQHLGVELHPVSRRPASSAAATGVPAVRAVTAKPGGAAVHVSPCDIHTCCRPGSPPSSTPPGRQVDSAVAPYSPTRCARPAAQAGHHQLESVADAEHRDARPAAARPARAGRPAAYTEAGPPDRMMALGLRASISAAGMVAGTISEYTWHSRTRRAISWAYWAPKSTTRTVSAGAPFAPPAGLVASGAAARSQRRSGRRLGPRVGGAAGGRGARPDPHPGDAAAVQLGHGQPRPVDLHRLVPRAGRWPSAASM